MITTGGLNTTHEAIWFATPMLNLPIGGIDAAGNATRMAFHGVGDVAVGENLDPATLANKIQRLLDDEDVAARLAELSAVVRGANSVALAADAIEAELHRASRP